MKTPKYASSVTSAKNQLKTLVLQRRPAPSKPPSSPAPEVLLLVPLAVELAAIDPTFFFTVFRCLNRKIQSFVHQNRQPILDGIKEHPRYKKFSKFITLESFAINSLRVGSKDTFKLLVLWAHNIQIDWIVIASHFGLGDVLDDLLKPTLPTLSEIQTKKLTKALLLYCKPSGPIIRVLGEHGIELSDLKTPEEKLDFVIRLRQYEDEVIASAKRPELEYRIVPRYYVLRGFTFPASDMIKILDKADWKEGVVKASHEIHVPTRKKFRHERSYDLKSYDLMNCYLMLLKIMFQCEPELKKYAESSPLTPYSAKFSSYPLEMQKRINEGATLPARFIIPPQEITDSGHRKEIASFLNHLFITCAKWKYDGNSLVCFAFHHHPFTTPPDKVIAKALENVVSCGNSATFDSILIHLIGPCDKPLPKITNKFNIKPIPPLPPIVEKTLVNMMRHGPVTQYTIDTFLDSHVMPGCSHFIKAIITEGMTRSKHLPVVAMLFVVFGCCLSQAFLKQMRDVAKAAGMKTMIEMIDIAIKESSAHYASCMTMP